jgi:hypothetical protein
MDMIHETSALFGRIATLLEASAKAEQERAANDQQVQLAQAQRDNILLALLSNQFSGRASAPQVEQPPNQ